MSAIESVRHRHRWATPRKFATVLLAAFWLATWFAPRHAYAQSEADRATARNLAAEGYTALRTQDYVTAEDRFRRADALVHAPTLVVDHARALIGLGRFVEAQERLELVSREGVANNAPRVWKKAIQDAEELVNLVKPKVSWLTITVSGSKDPLVMVDGTAVPVAALGVRRAVDPGPRRISATGDGCLPKEVSVTMPAGGERAVTLELTLDPATVPVQPRVEKPKEKPLPRPIPEKRPSNALAYAAFGLGGAGLVVGTVTGVVALGKRSELRDKYGCGDGFCDAQGRSTLDEYNRYGIISGVGFGVGLASSAVGVWLLLSRSGPETPKRPTASVVPYVSVGDVGVTGAF